MRRRCVEWIELDDGRRYHVVGVQYKPHPQVVLKVDYRNIDSAGGELPDDIQVGFGFVF